MVLNLGDSIVLGLSLWLALQGVSSFRNLKLYRGMTPAILSLSFRILGLFILYM
jgi:hypothetical protein